MNKKELGQYIPIHYHYQMLSDNDRMDAFEGAIRETITPRQRVVDLGSGTGVLSYHAAKVGANVVGIEFNEELAMESRQFLADNHVNEQVEIITKDAMEWMADKPVDVVVCEMLHCALLREKQVEIITHFRDKHKTKFGKIPTFIPAVTLLGVQPVFSQYEFNGFIAKVPLFMDAYASDVDLISIFTPAVYKTIDYSVDNFELIEGDVTFEPVEACSFNALRFITKNILSMNHSTGGTIDWHNQYLVLPLALVYKVDQGQKVVIKFEYMPGDKIQVLQSSISVLIE